MSNHLTEGEGEEEVIATADEEWNRGSGTRQNPHQNGKIVVGAFDGERKNGVDVSSSSFTSSKGTIELPPQQQQKTEIDEHDKNAAPAGGGVVGNRWEENNAGNEVKKMLKFLLKFYDN